MKKSVIIGLAALFIAAACEKEQHSNQESSAGFKKIMQLIG